MNCDGVRELLSAYVDGELSPGELLRVEQHLRRCHACAEEVDSLRQTIALVASLDEVEVPPSFHLQLHERLVALGPSMPDRRRTAVAQRPGSLRRWMAPAAAAAALAIGLGAYGQLGRLPLAGLGSSPGQQVADGATPAPKVSSSQSNATAGSGNTTAPAPTQTAVTQPTNNTSDQTGSASTPDSHPVTPVSGGSGASSGGTTATGSGAGAPPGIITPDPGGPAVASSPIGTGAAQAPLTPVYHYSATVTVPAVSAAAVAAAIQSQFPDALQSNGLITLDVPAASYQPDLDAITKVAPGMTVTQSQQDYAQPIQDAEDLLASLKADQFKLTHATDIDAQTMALQQQAMADKIAVAQENLNGLYRLRDRAAIVISFQAAAQSVTH